MNRLLLAAAVASVAVPSASVAATTVVLDGRANAIAAPVVLDLTAGSYNIVFLEFSDTTKTLNRFGSTTNWEARFAYTINNGTIMNIGPTGNYVTDAAAFAAVQGQTFTLDVASNARYRFFISDSAPANNIGGIRFTISDSSVVAPVPEPGSWAMMIVGFGLTGGAIRARHRTRSTFASA